MAAPCELCHDMCLTHNHYFGTDAEGLKYPLDGHTQLLYNFDAKISMDLGLYHFTVDNDYGVDFIKNALYTNWNTQ
jgi:hypothetical protein